VKRTALTRRRRLPRRPVRIDWSALQAAAHGVLERAHAPYSGLHVAAALLAADGRIVTGVNVENASYGLSVCAERNAIGSAVAQGCGELRALLVLSSAPSAITPCGACRQVLQELAPTVAVRCVGRDGRVIETNAAALLPGAFSRSSFRPQRPVPATRRRRAARPSP